MGDKKTIATVVDSETHNLVARTARAYGKSVSQIVGEAIKLFFAERPDIVSAVSELPELPEL